MHNTMLVLLLVLLQTTVSWVRGSRTILVWHGMGDSCDGPMHTILDMMEEHIVDARVHCVHTPGGDILGSFVGNVAAQVETVCEDMKKEDDFRDGYIGLGFSQGGLFVRALAQKCDVPMRLLISIGGPQSGVVSLPSCDIPFSSMYCRAISYFVEWVGFWPMIQRSIVQAQYLYSPFQPPKSSHFLSDINGDLSQDVTNGTCQEYKRRINRLERMVLFQFTNDTMVEPPESSHFGVFNGRSIVPIQEQRHMTHCLGLDTLMASNRLDLRFVDGEHMQFTMKWFREHVIEPYLSSSLQEMYDEPAF